MEDASYAVRLVLLLGGAIIYLQGEPSMYTHINVYIASVFVSVYVPLSVPAPVPVSI